jgi:hypothetical protein
MAIPTGLKRVALGSTKPPRRGPKPPKSRTKEIHSRVVSSITHIARVRTISPTSRSTNGFGYPHFVFTGYTFDDTSGTGHVGSTNILSDFEFTINTVHYTTSAFTVTVNPTNIVVSFTEPAFDSDDFISSDDIVRLRARVKTVS